MKKWRTWRDGAWIGANRALVSFVKRFAIVVVALLAIGNANAAIDPSERAVLDALFASTNGANWTNKTGWGVASDECTWFGISCDVGKTHVVKLKLMNNNLDGTLPPDLNKLALVQELNLAHNKLTGTIPSLTGFFDLQLLTLFNNKLSGTPPALNTVPTLQEVSFGFNQLTGTIPPLAGLSSLRVFDVGKNQLTGTLPSIVGLTELGRFSAGSNQLTGALPELNSTPKLETFEVGDNKFTGAIPSLSNVPLLKRFNVGFNQLSGPLPSIEHLPSLFWFDARSNALSGSIPPLPNPTSLSRYFVGQNQLTGTIPGLSAQTGLVEFDVSVNNLIGTIPPLSANKALVDLRLNNNALTGTMPPLTGLTKLARVAVADNQLVGALPNFSDLPLQWVRFHNNQLSGPIPAAPLTLLPDFSELCPGNQFDNSLNAAWDAATVGAGAWSMGCVAPKIAQSLDLMLPLSGIAGAANIVATAVPIPNPGSTAQIQYASLTPSVCTVNATSGQVTIPVSTPLGSLCRIGANKAGDANHNSAVFVERPLVVTKNVNPNACRIDIDGDGKLFAETDGLLLLRYLMGFRDTALTDGLTLSGLRTTGAAISSFIASNNYDVMEGAFPPAPRATVEGKVIMRYLRGVPALQLLIATGIDQDESGTVMFNINAWCP
jgi:Leucine-rich repeat (LRR) protein